MAADLQPQQGVVIQGACLVGVPGGAQQQRSCPPVPDVAAGVAADLFQVGIGDFGKGQAELAAQQPDQVGGPACLHLRFEDGPAGERERGLRGAGRLGEPGVGSDQRLVRAGRVEHRPAGAPGVGGECRHGTGGVAERRGAPAEHVELGVC